METDWIEVKIGASADAAELLGLLGDPMISGSWQETDVIHLYWPRARWNPGVLEEIRRALCQLGVKDDAVIEVKSLPDRDWNALWASTVKPIRVGQRVRIRPSWDDGDSNHGVDAGRSMQAPIELVIDPKQAFGTGHHATTQLLIEWLEEIITGGERVLDVGTGSGILAMVALRLGAASALAIDSDAVAIECAREYADRNRFGSELILRTITLQDLAGSDGSQYDLILANLDRGTLVGSSALLISLLRPGGRLLLSGMLLEDQQALASCLGQWGAFVSRARRRDGWLALEVMVPDPCDG